MLLGGAACYLIGELFRSRHASRLLTVPLAMHVAIVPMLLPSPYQGLGFLSTLRCLADRGFVCCAPRLQTRQQKADQPSPRFPLDHAQNRCIFFRPRFPPELTVTPRRVMDVWERRLCGSFPVRGKPRARILCL